MPRPRFAILFAEEDHAHRAAATGALEALALTVTPLRAGSLLDPGAPALVIWTAQAARRGAIARKLLADVQDIVLWRPDGAPAPDWLARAYPIGPEMPVRTLTLMAQLAIAESERRIQMVAPKRRPLGKIALGVVAGGGVLLAIAGAAMLIATRDETRAAEAASTPIAGLRGTQ